MMCGAAVRAAVGAGVGTGIGVGAAVGAAVRAAVGAKTCDLGRGVLLFFFFVLGTVQDDPHLANDSVAGFECVVTTTHRKPLIRQTLCGWNCTALFTKVLPCTVATPRVLGGISKQTTIWFPAAAIGMQYENLRVLQ